MPRQLYRNEFMPTAPEAEVVERLVRWMQANIDENDSIRDLDLGGIDLRLVHTGASYHLNAPDWKTVYSPGSTGWCVCKGNQKLFRRDIMYAKMLVY